MPSLRRTYWFFMPPHDGEEQASVAADTRVFKLLCWWVFELLICSLVWWSVFLPGFYAVYSHFRKGLTQFYLDIVFHVLSSQYGLVWAYVIALVTITKHSKCFIATRMFLSYLLIMAVLLPIVVSNYRNAKKNGDPSTEEGPLCEMVRPLNCGVYLIHLTVEWALFPTFLLLFTSVQVWYHDRCCFTAKGTSFLEIYSDPNSESLLNLETEINSSRIDSLGGAEKLSESLSTNLRYADPCPETRKMTDYIPPAIKHRLSLMTEPGRRDTYTELDDCQSIASSNDGSVFDNRVGMNRTIIKKNEPKKKSSTSRKMTMQEQWFVNRIKCDPISAQSNFRTSLMAYCWILALNQFIWSEFATLSAHYANRHYDWVLLSFFSFCFVIKRPLRWLSSNIDVYRMEMTESKATMNDISIEIMNEFFISFGYFAYIHMRAIKSGTEYRGISFIMDDFLISNVFHVGFELLDSFIQPMPWYFTWMKHLRLRMKKCLLIFDTDTDNHNNVVVVNNHNECCYCPLTNRLKTLLFEMMDLYLREFQCDSNESEYRSRCFIDSQLRLLASVISGILTWVQALCAYVLGYHMGTYQGKYRMSDLLISLQFLCLQISINLVLYAFIHCWYHCRYGYTSYRPIFILTKKCRNPRYLFTLMCSIIVFLQLMLFM